MRDVYAATCIGDCDPMRDDFQIPDEYEYVGRENHGKRNRRLNIGWRIHRLI